MLHIAHPKLATVAPPRLTIRLGGLRPTAAMAALLALAAVVVGALVLAVAVAVASALGG